MTLLVVDVPAEVMEIIDILVDDKITPKYTNRSDVVYGALRTFLMDIQGDSFHEHITDFVERIDGALDALERHEKRREKS